MTVNDKNLGKMHIKIMVFVSSRTTKRRGVKPTKPLRKKKPFFYDLKKLPEPHETQERLTKKYCILCSVRVNIDLKKNIMKMFY